MVKLSKTEAGYIFFSEICTYITFIRSIAEFIELRIEYPVVVYVDNIGKNIIDNSTEMLQQTKNIGLRHYFILDYLGESVLSQNHKLKKIVWMSLWENEI